MSRFVCLGLAWLAAVGLVSAERAADEKKTHTVELRWAEDKAVKGVTEDRGVDLSCSDKKAYLHAKPILTRADLDRGKSRQLGVGGAPKNGPPTQLVELRVKEAAAKTLAESSAKNKGKPLVLLIDGKIVGATIIMSDLTDTVPMLSALSSEDLQIVTEPADAK